MADADDQSRSSPPAAPARGWLVGLICLFAWASLAFWVWDAVREAAPARFPRRRLPSPGSYDTVRAVTGPAGLRFSDLGEVRLAGVAPPRTGPFHDRAVARLRELAPPGTRVYVEPEASTMDDGRPTPAASVFLPPATAEGDGAFSYQEAMLLAAVLLQEGLARTDQVSRYRYRNEFRMLEADARRHGRGVWSGE